MADEIFFVLFLNRQLLRDFVEMISGYIADYDIGTSDEPSFQVDNYFEKNGILKRVAIPSWVQRAVFHRDRGMCVHCSKDISGLVSVSSIENFDHMIPLAKGGINDVTNIQLLCESCNKSKKDKIEQLSSKYEKWF